MAAKTTKNKPQDIENQVAISKAQGTDVPQVIKEMGDLQVLVQTSLANLSSALTAKVQTFADIDKAVSFNEQRLTELHGIETELLSIESIKALRAEEADAAVKERQARAEETKQEKEERNRAWKREAEEHEYTTRVQNQRALDEFNAEIERQKRAEKLRQDDLAREWADREAKLKAQEQEVVALQNQAATFEARVKNEISKEVAIVRASIEREHKHSLALLMKETETSERIHQSEVESLKTTIETLRAQVASLTSDLASARADAKDVATQALQSASGRQTTDALMKAIDTQNAGKK